MNETHELADGRTICPRHKGGMTYVGQNCICGYWACTCGATIALRKGNGLITVDEAWERHALAEGADLPTVEALEATMDIMQQVERERESEFAADFERVAERKKRALRRALQKDPRSAFWTLENLAASAAIYASMHGEDADEAHEQAYFHYRQIAERAGVLGEAQDIGLTRRDWLELAASDNITQGL